MRYFIFIVLLLCAGVASAQTYRWVDEDGVVHYSDRPVEGAEEVSIDYIRPSSMARQPGTVLRRDRRAAADSAAAEQGAETYQSLEIASPAEEETIWNNAGLLTVSLSLQPGLQTGHRVRVYLDGTPTDASSTSVELSDVYRGAHTLQAEVLDASGTMLLRSQPRTFFVQQTSVRRN